MKDNDAIRRAWEKLTQSLQEKEKKKPVKKKEKVNRAAKRKNTS